MKEPQSQTITLSVRVTPRAKRNTVTKMKDGSVKVYVTAPPEDGRANEAVVETIAEWLGVKRRQVTIVSGATGRNKLVRLTGVSQEQIDTA
ncbi:MAG TPA: DUF167 domain-containing protein [Verrucomicrobiae bacterium]|nr:DUF167 domain-containing protein [Verrucomicrobiae bacterium]